MLMYSLENLKLLKDDMEKKGWAIYSNESNR